MLRARGEPHAFDVLRGGLKVAPRRVGAARRAQPAQRARRDRRGRARRRRARGRGRGARAAFATCGAASSCAARSAASPSTTTSRTTRPRSAPPSTACAARSGTARILAVFEPRSNTMKLGAMKAQLPWALEEADLVVLPQRRPGLGRRRGAGAAGRARRRRRDASTSWSRASSPAARPGDHVLCMSNGGFGGVHAEAARRGSPATSAPRHERAPPAARRRSRTCSTCTASARRRSRPRRGAMAAWVRAHRPDLVWCCPQLPPSPQAAIDDVMAAIAGWPRERMAVVGSSLGGFYATVVAERTGCRAVLLNPAVDPARDLAAYIGEQTAWHSDEALLLPRRVHRRAARARAAGAAHAARALLRRHRQGRRGAVMARDERALRRLPHAPARGRRPRAERLRRPPARRSSASSACGPQPRLTCSSGRSSRPPGPRPRC